MKKLIAVPVVAVLAAVGAASAAGFVGGVSAAPIQSGDTYDLQCATSASVVEWGHNDHTNPPYVDSALIKLTDSECQGQAVHLIALSPGGTELARFKSERLDPALGAGTQYIRLAYAGPPGSGVPTADLNAIRISVDGGYPGMTVDGSNTNP
ncbi:hypothetical protein [Nocardioides pacificus]